jgi:hypothetical protein
MCLSGSLKTIGVVLRGTRIFNHVKIRCEKSFRICSNFYAPLRTIASVFSHDRNIIFLTSRKNFTLMGWNEKF